MKCRATIVGVSPLIMHNGQLANPLHPIQREISKITSKKKKTEADHAQVAKLEYCGSLYYDEDMGPYLPTYVLEGTLISGAKKFNQGPIAKSATYVVDDVPLSFEGPRTPEELYADEAFVTRNIVRVKQNRTPRTRPIFPKWSVTFDIEFDEEQADLADVERWLQKAGATAAIGDWRPRFGRFKVEEFEVVKE